MLYSDIARSNEAYLSSTSNPSFGSFENLRFRFETGPASISIVSNAWQTCHTRGTFGNLISRAATAAAEPNRPLDRQTALRSGHLLRTCWLQSPGSRLCLRLRTELVLA